LFYSSVAELLLQYQEPLFQLLLELLLNASGRASVGFELTVFSAVC
jgi:hypothetical protein